MEIPTAEKFPVPADLKKAQAEYEKWLASNPQPKVLTKFTEPQEVILEGALTNLNPSADEKPRVSKGSTNEYRIGTVGGEEFLISEPIFQSNRTVLSLDNIVKVNCERRIAYKTGYFDKDGVEQTHKSSGLGMNTCSLETTFATDRVTQKSELTVKSDVRDNAIAKQTARIVKAIGDDKQALAVALAGSFNAIQ